MFVPNTQMKLSLSAEEFGSVNNSLPIKCSNLFAFTSAFSRLQ